MSHRTPAVQQGEKRLERKLAVALKTIGKSVANRLAHLGKAEEEEDPAARAVEAIDWDPVVEAAETELTLVARDGATRALAEIDIDDESITEQTFTSAVEFAKARAAELVGKSWDEDGELIDNPDADMAISDSMREDLRDAIAQAVEDGDSAAELSDRIEELAAFSAERADLIAKTEIIRSHAQGQMSAMRESGVVQRKAWSTSEDGDVCEDCVANEEQGDIDIDDDFDSGDDAPPCHPNDRCSVVAVISDESDDEAASDDDETDGDDENATDASDDTE